MALQTASQRSQSFWDKHQKSLNLQRAERVSLPIENPAGEKFFAPVR
jgi:hypothetical protein